MTRKLPKILGDEGGIVVACWGTFGLVWWIVHCIIAIPVLLTKLRVDL
jgi:hypothetical protein